MEIIYNSIASSKVTFLPKRLFFENPDKLTEKLSMHSSIAFIADYVSHPRNILSLKEIVRTVITVVIDFCN